MAIMNVSGRDIFAKLRSFFVTFFRFYGFMKFMENYFNQITMFAVVVLLYISSSYFQPCGY